MAIFIVLGSLVAAAIWVGQRRAWGTLRRIMFLLLVLVAAVLVVSLARDPISITLGPQEAWYESTPAPEIYYFVVMLFGMAARYITRAIEMRRERIAQLEKLGEPFNTPGLEFDRWEFSYPFFLSIVTYGALLPQLSDATFNVTSTILSFQTGFFWQTILGARQAKVSS